MDLIIDKTMKDFYIYHAIPVGFTLLMTGTLNVLIGACLFVLRKKSAAKPLILAGIGLAILGLIVLGIAIGVGGWGIFDA